MAANRHAGSEKKTIIAIFRETARTVPRIMSLFSSVIAEPHHVLIIYRLVERTWPRKLFHVHSDNISKNYSGTHTYSE